LGILWTSIYDCGSEFSDQSLQNLHLDTKKGLKMPTLIRISSLLLVFGLLNNSFADDAADAKAIVDKGIEAVGGVETVKKQVNAQWSETGNYFGMGDAIPYQGKYVFSLPNKARMEIVGIFTIVVDGDKGWMKTAQEVRALTDDELKEQHQVFHIGYVTSLVPFSRGEKGYSFTLAGDSDVDGEACVGVICDKKGFRTVKIEFSKKTGLLMRATYTVKAPEQGNKEVTEEAIYKNWKKEDGVMSARKMVVNRDGKKFIESEPGKIEYPQTLDAELFAEPK
jgi:outer membrane lipoprotein-sorting protein